MSAEEAGSRQCSFQPVTHCIFELDGLLIDSERLRTETVQRILDPYGHTYSFDLKMRCMGKPDSEQAALIVNTFNLPFSMTEFENQQELQCRGKMGFIRLMPGVERLLHHLKAFNIPMAIASGCCRDSFRIKTRRHSRLFDVFHHVVLSGSDEEVKRGNPLRMFSSPPPLVLRNRRSRASVWSSSPLWLVWRLLCPLACRWSSCPILWYPFEQVLRPL